MRQRQVAGWLTRIRNFLSITELPRPDCLGASTRTLTPQSSTSHMLRKRHDYLDLCADFGQSLGEFGCEP